MTVTAEDLGKTHCEDSWCPGCGDIVIVKTVRKAIANLGLDPKDVVLVSGIGCGSKLPHYVKTYGFEGLHGRALPVATGIKLANHKLKVIVIGGDGDGYGIGGNHFLHTMRRNLDITYLVQNNEVYGLTKGQSSPTSAHGFESVTTPSGTIEMPINPLSIAMSTDATFVGRTYAMDPKGSQQIIEDAIMHKGVALVDILQPCPTWRKDLTYAWFKQNTEKLPEDYDPTNREAAIAKAAERAEKFRLGVYYKVDAPTYTGSMHQLKDKALVEQPIDNIDIQGFFDSRK